MTGRPPALDELDHLDIGSVPLRDILASGRTIRRRRRRATLTAVAAVAAVIVGGGVFAAGQFGDSDVARDPAAADGAVRPAPGDLSVVVLASELTERDSDDARGSARWDASSQTVIYESRDGYSSSCPPTGTATSTGQEVSLVLDEDPSFVACTADARDMTVTISGLTTAPAGLAVTENGELLTTPVVNGSLQLPCDPSDQVPWALDAPGPGRATPLKAVAQYANGTLFVEQSSGVTEPSEGPVSVHEIGVDGEVSRTFKVSRRDDGWWPDGWVECSGAPTSDPTDRVSPGVPQEAVTAASAFVSFARGETAQVPWAETVGYTIVGTPVADLTREDAADPSAWAGCPTAPYAFEETYEGRDCPVSPLTTSRGAEVDGPVVIESQRPEVFGCNIYRAESDSPGRTIWIRPAADSRSCFTDFALSVTLNDSAEIAHVDLALSGP